MPRTEQSLGTPQQHSIPVSKPRNIQTSTTPNISRSQVGPDLAVLKPTPPPKSNAEPWPSALLPEPDGLQSASKPNKNRSQSELKKTVSNLAKSERNPELAKKITEDTPAAKLLMSAAKSKSGDLKNMKVAPRTLIASLEKYVQIPPEQLIGEDMIDLENIDIEPAAEQAAGRLEAVVAKTGKPVEAPQADLDLTALGEKPEKRPHEPDDLTGLVMADTTPVANVASTALQPVGMSFFERFALSTMIASENHLAALPEAGKPKPVSTATTPDGPVIPPTPPVIAPVIGEPDAVTMVHNDIPPSSVNPGLDEMVISATNQTDFDLNDSEMVFSGNVQVQSPRFNLRSDKFIVHLKKDNSGMSFGEALGNVVIDMRENGRPSGYSGLASKAIYDPNEGKITLSGWPKIRQQFKEHVAVTEDTKMILYTDGRVQTLGRNRTIIRK